VEEPNLGMGGGVVVVMVMRFQSSSTTQKQNAKISNGKLQCGDRRKQECQVERSKPWQHAFFISKKLFLQNSQSGILFSSFVMSMANSLARKVDFAASTMPDL
jgi:hypothetical protein